MDLSNYEKETIILYNQEEKTASVYTYHPALIKKLEDGCKKYPDMFKFEHEEAGGRTYTIPKKYVSVRLPKVISEEARQEMGQRLTKSKTKV